MEKLKKSVFFIGVGLFNLLHSSLHLIQFVQSIFLINNSLKDNNHEESLIDSILHHPLFAIIWGIIGIFTLVIGVKDFIHHKKCDNSPNIT